MNKELKEIALDLGKMNDLELSIYYEVAKEKKCKMYLKL